MTQRIFTTKGKWCDTTFMEKGGLCTMEKSGGITSEVMGGSILCRLRRTSEGESIKGNRIRRWKGA